MNDDLLKIKPRTMLYMHVLEKKILRASFIIKINKSTYLWRVFILNSNKAGCMLSEWSTKCFFGLSTVWILKLPTPQLDLALCSVLSHRHCLGSVKNLIFQFVLQPGIGSCKSQISLKASLSFLMFNNQYGCRCTDDLGWLLLGSAFGSLMQADTPSSPGTADSSASSSCSPVGHRRLLSCS